MTTLNVFTKLMLTLCFAQIVFGNFSVQGDDSVTTFRQIYPNKENVISIERTEASWLRFKIMASTGGAPAIDEILVYESSSPDKGNLTFNDVKRVDASSCISGYDIHKIENIVDGKFGNNASWVADSTASYDAPQWILIEWNHPVCFDTIIFSRDRSGEYADRTPLEFEIETSLDGKIWKSCACIHGVTTELNSGRVIAYDSEWITNVPVSPVNEWTRVSNENVIGFPLSEYDNLLQEAFLAEENSLLKIAGFADCEHGLIQRHYPEFVEPAHKEDEVVPLGIWEHNSDFRVDNFWSETFGNIASSATSFAFAPGNFASGPLVEQTARAVILGDSLFLQITGNRFLSDNRAMASTENLPTRGFIVVRDKSVFWKQIDALDGRSPGDEVELSGKWDSDSGVLSAIVPLRLLPEVKERGFYLTLGIGARNVLAGGRPVHFQPANFSANLDYSPDADGMFKLVLKATEDKSVRLAVDDEEIYLEQGSTKTINLPAFWGQVGPEASWEALDVENGRTYRLQAFYYDPCYRPFCQLKDALERAQGNADDSFDLRDFEKRSLISGAVNPRYVDFQKICNSLHLPNERLALIDFFNKIDLNDSTIESDRMQEFKARALNLWQEYWDNCISSDNDDELGNDFVKAQLLKRDLFWNVRLLKRDLFLASEELASVEHILANKRNPFWPSHNYSDLFDSVWNPGGAVVSIDIPWVNGKLAPELATTRTLVRAGEGVIRNPSLSFDAKRVYYSLRKSKDDYFRIYELNLETGISRQISSDEPFHDFWPTELPDGDLAFVSTRCKKKFICWRPQAFVLFRMNKNGGDIKPLSFANLTEFAPSISDDGRILWTRSEYVDKGADYGHTLWAIHADGTSPELIFGNTINLPQGYANGRRVPDSEEVCCVMISHFGDLNGPVALIDLSKGPHDPSGIRSITPEAPWPGFSAKSETFREPIPLTRDFFLVAHAPLDRFGIYLLDRYGNRELLTIDKNIDTICPQPFLPRELPPITGNSIDSELQVQKMGRFSVANVYRGLEGKVRRGTAKYLRVCQEMPTPLAQLKDGTFQSDHEPFMEYYASPVDVLQGAFGWPSYVAKGVLGTVKIEDDGSVDFLAPAGKVLFFELLDENFNEIQRMRSVVQLQPGERRSCIGCHENRLSAPSGGASMATAHASQTLNPPAWGAGAFWYERFVQPVLDSKCIHCHNSQEVESNSRQIDLTGTRDSNKIPASYKSLIQSGTIHYFDYVWAGGKTTKAEPYTFGTFNSPIWDILNDERHAGISLTIEEEQAIKCWIDLNVPLWGDYQKRSERE